MDELKSKIAFQEKVYDTLHDLISTSDNKSTLALTIQTFLMGSVFGTSFITEVIARETYLNILWTQINLKLLILIFAITSLLGIVISILVLYPRKPKEKNEIVRKGLTYYIHISEYKTSDEYSAKLKDINNDKILDEYNKQNYNLAHIVKRKMLLIRIVFIMILINLIQSITIIFLMS